MNFFAWWFTLSLPANRSRNTPIERRRCRYEDLTSSFTLFLFVTFIPTFILMVFFSPQSPSSPPTAIAGLCLITLSLLCGRLRKQKLSATIILFYISAMIGIPIATDQTQPLVFAVSYVLVFAIILAGALITPGASIITAICISLFMIAVIFGEPHPASYISVISSYNYSVMLVAPVFIFLLVGCAMVLILGQLNKTIARADRAEEIVSLQTEIAVHEMRRKQEILQLEEGVKMIAEAHRRFANGDVSVRVPVEQFTANNPLGRVVFSLNTFFSRVESWKKEVIMAKRTEAVINELVHELQSQGLTLETMPTRTGTLLDALLRELKATT